MFYRLLFLLCRIPVFSVSMATSAAAVVALSANPSMVIPIDVMQRGTEVYNTFVNLGVPHANSTNYPEFLLQTTLAPSSYLSYKGISNGIIPFIQTITPTTHNTLLIISYVYKGQTNSIQQTIVLPTEQISAMVYIPSINNQPTSVPATYTTSFPNGTLSFFLIDPKQRAADIASAVSTLMKGAFRSGGAAQSQVYIQTSLSGPFNPNPNGLLKNITGITLNDSLLYVQYAPPNLATQTIVLAPEQVQQIIYIYNINTP